MITGFYGKPGAGKTTILSAYALKAQKKIALREKWKKSLIYPSFRILFDCEYNRIFSNCDIDGTYKIQVSDLGVYDMSYSLILLDEAGVNLDNRDFKRIPKSATDFFAEHRKYHTNIVWVSQSDDVDKKLRDRTAELFKINKFAWWSISTRIFPVMDVDKDSHQLVFGWRMPIFFEHLLGLLLFPFRVRKFYFRPKYYRMFNSWDAKPLPEHKFELVKR